MQLVAEKVKEIAGYLDAGFRCFVHKDTKEVVFFPNEDRFMEIEKDVWKEDVKKVKKRSRDFIEIEDMDDRDSFRSMEAFVDTIDNESMKERLSQALYGQKPFANFRQQIDGVPVYRKQWFDFKEKNRIDWIEKQLVRRQQ